VLPAWILLSPFSAALPVDPDPAQTAGHGTPASYGSIVHPPGLAGLLGPGSEPARWASVVEPDAVSPPGRSGTRAAEGALDVDLLAGEGGQVPDVLGAQADALAAAGDLRAHGAPREFLEALVSTPLGEDLLQLAAEVFTPAIDRAGQLHVSLLGHGDFVVPGWESRLTGDGAGAGAPVRDAALLARPLPGVGGSATGDGPLTVREFVALLAGELTAFVTHPLTVLITLLGGVGYLSLRFALERRALRVHHTRAHAHHSRRHRSHHHHAHRRSPRARGLPRRP
jgi:hypothetical protein